MKRWRFDDLIRIMARLRSPNGCLWDREQTHRTLLRYLREESMEVEKAVRKKDDENLCEELGDLLLQIVFHAQMAKERKRFGMADVVDGICRKLIRRHPHVFGDKKLHTAEDVITQWNEIKKREKRTKR
ncbi:MAG: MazG family protein [Elusimicrobia bacterium]|nr:MazG family protein [Elusimicrobiota bacterium]